MKVYAVLYNWNNAEGYPEDYLSDTKLVKIFDSLDKAKNYIAGLTLDDFLGFITDRRPGWEIEYDSGLEMNDDANVPFRQITLRIDYLLGFTCKSYDENELIFSVQEMEVE